MAVLTRCMSLVTIKIRSTWPPEIRTSFALLFLVVSLFTLLNAPSLLFFAIQVPQPHGLPDAGTRTDMETGFPSKITPEFLDQYSDGKLLLYHCPAERPGRVDEMVGTVLYLAFRARGKLHWQCCSSRRKCSMCRP